MKISSTTSVGHLRPTPFITYRYGLERLTCCLLHSMQICLQKDYYAVSASNCEYSPIIRRNLQSCIWSSFVDSLTLKNMALWSFEMSVNFYQLARRNIARFLYRQQRRWENLESQKYFSFYITSYYISRKYKDDRLLDFDYFYVLPYFKRFHRCHVKGDRNLWIIYIYIQDDSFGTRPK